MIEKSVCIFYQKDSAPHAMTLMKEIEFMIGLFTGTQDRFIYILLTGSRPLFGKSHCWSKSLNPIFVFQNYDLHQKSYWQPFFAPKTGFFLPVRAT